MNNLPEDITSQDCSMELRDVDFIDSVVSKLLCNIELNKSPGPDMILPNVLKECS